MTITTIKSDKQCLDDFRLIISPFQNNVSEKRIGRPLFGGKNVSEVVAKLEYAFTIGALVKEACNYADISVDSFYRYCKSNPEFRNRIDLLQTTPALLAKIAIFKSIQEGNIKTSVWYLERKRPAEFSSSATSQKLEQAYRRIEHLQNLLIDNGVDFDY